MCFRFNKIPLQKRFPHQWTWMHRRPSSSKMAAWLMLWLQQPVRLWTCICVWWDHNRIMTNVCAINRTSGSDMSRAPNITEGFQFVGLMTSSPITPEDFKGCVHPGQHQSPSSPKCMNPNSNCSHHTLSFKVMWDFIFLPHTESGLAVSSDCFS